MGSLMGETNHQLTLNYDELVEYLQNKYGIPKGNYFRTESRKTQNPNIKRTKDGLYIHHVREDMFIDLSKTEFAKSQPWEYQLSYNLVYCNLFEHIILHGKIMEKVQHPCNDIMGRKMILGYGGLVNHICPPINDFYNHLFYPVDWRARSYQIIEGEEKTYFVILRYLCEVFDNFEVFPPLDKRLLFIGTDGKIGSFITEERARCYG